MSPARPVVREDLLLQDLQLTGSATGMKRTKVELARLGFPQRVPLSRMERLRTSILGAQWKVVLRRPARCIQDLILRLSA
ncbi:hypothetical protein C3E77_05700 [Mycetocola zhujimingii]|nr:hypothetical protein C3E77_05700 [Mycetocola zhujimingii]